jgi:UDP-N-acetylmuramate: L-alanyl-gamma-D-glutamyl-meso-diaminopimelate ligase
MAPLAILLAERGHAVTGSDTALYPPMSKLLARAGIPVAAGFAAENVPPECDCVVIGNAVPRDNPEVLEVVRRGLPYISMPQAIERYLLPGKQSVVVAGTHGKTTTSALLAWLLLDSGRDPGFLIGGEMKNLGRGFRDGAGPVFLLEGDEYNTAFFDRGPKFLHYRPRMLLLNNIEFDHADLYPDLESLVTVFTRLARLVPADGAIVANTADPAVARAIGGAPGRFIPVGLDSAQGYAAGSIAVDSAGTRFDLLRNGQPLGRFLSPLYGRHNLQNAMMALAAALDLGLSPQEAAAALPRFAGVKRRLEVLAESNGVTYVDDFAHHPTAVRETLAAARLRWPGRRLWAVFEPRSITAGRKFFERDYREAFAQSDVAVIAPVFHAGRFDARELIDRDSIAASLASEGKLAHVPDRVGDIGEILARDAMPGDVVVLMSSGDFGGLRQRLDSSSRPNIQS